MPTFEEKVQAFADLLESEQHEVLGARYPGIDLSGDDYLASVRPGKVYTKVDFGTSGKYMVEHSTGIIYGIKAYGVIHRGHSYGTLDTIHEWHWGEYAGHRKVVV